VKRFTAGGMKWGSKVTYLNLRDKSTRFVEVQVHPLSRQARGEGIEKSAKI
jgi:hypothetical protein